MPWSFRRLTDFTFDKYISSIAHRGAPKGGHTNGYEHFDSWVPTCRRTSTRHVAVLHQNMHGHHCTKASAIPSLFLSFYFFLDDSFAYSRVPCHSVWPLNTAAVVCVCTTRLMAHEARIMLHATSRSDVLSCYLFPRAYSQRPHQKQLRLVGEWAYGLMASPAN